MDRMAREWALASLVRYLGLSVMCGEVCKHLLSAGICTLSQVVHRHFSAPLRRGVDQRLVYLDVELHVSERVQMVGELDLQVSIRSMRTEDARRALARRCQFAALLRSYPSHDESSLILLIVDVLFSSPFLREPTSILSERLCGRGYALVPAGLALPESEGLYHFEIK